MQFFEKVATLCLFLPSFLAATDNTKKVLSGIYVGAIEKRAVVFYIKQYTNKNDELRHYRAKYFYRDASVDGRRDKDLSIRTLNNGLIIMETGKNKEGHSWQLTVGYSRQGRRYFTGTRKLKNGKTTQYVVFRKVDISAVIDSNMDRIYKSYKIDLKLISARTVKHAGITYTWRYSNARKSKYRLQYPYLSKLKSLEVLEAINSIIEVNHRANVLQALDCDQSIIDIKSQWQGEFKLISQVSLLSRKIMNIDAHASWVCAGIAISHHSDRSLIIDLHKGKVFHFREYFNNRAGYGKEPDQIKKLARKYYKLMSKPRQDYDCLQYYNPLYSYNLSFSKKGLLYKLVLPQADGVCVQDVLIPYSALRSYVVQRYRNIAR